VRLYALAASLALGIVLGWGWTTPAFGQTPRPVLTVTKAGNGSGTVTSSPAGINCGQACQAAFDSGTQVTLTAVAAPGSVFVEWVGGGCTGTAPCTVTLTADTPIVASFAIAFTVSVSKAGTGTGTVTSSPAGINCGTNCSAAFPTTVPVTLTAVSDPGSIFLGWSGGGCSGVSPCTVTAGAAASGTVAVTATFGPASALTVTKAGPGTGTVVSSPVGIDCGPACSASFPNGTFVTLTANPAPGSVFAGWSGGGCSGTAPCTVTLSASTAVTATFTTSAPALTVTKTGSGTGTVTSAPAGIACGPTCAATFDPGTTVTLTATPDVASIFAGWSGGGCAGTGPCTVVLTGPTEVTAIFASVSGLTVIRAGTGTGTVTSAPAGITCGTECSAPFPNATSVTLTATAAPDSTFAGWSGAGCSGTGTCTILVSGTALVTAVFRSNVSGAAVVASVLPSSRSVTVGTTATVFATIINLGPDPGFACTIAPATSVPATFAFQTTDPATNQLSGSANAPVDMAPGAAQSFLLSVTPTGPIAATDVQFLFKCSNSLAAPVSAGLNTLVLSAATTPIPDIVALAATVNNTGIVDIPGPTGTGVFSVATVNVGAEGVLTVSMDTGGVPLPVTLTLCQTDPQSGQCISAVAPSLSSKIDPGATPTYAVFVQGAGIVPFDPANHRIFVRFRDTGGVTRGSTSVAARTQ
jgi:hypothetical protein